jgi:hypothetical protein
MGQRQRMARKQWRVDWYGLDNRVCARAFLAGWPRLVTSVRASAAIPRGHVSLSLSLSFSLSQASAREEGQLVARPLPWPHALRRRGAIIMAAPNKLRFPSPPSSGTNSARLKSDLFSIH